MDIGVTKQLPEVVFGDPVALDNEVDQLAEKMRLEVERTVAVDGRLPYLWASDERTMDVIFSDQPVEVRHPSIFLAGPTPRSSDISSWRPQALALLHGLGFDGTVLVPERRDWSVRFDYLDQVEWEFAGLEECSVIAFWVPRHPESLQGFTTNVEFGRYVGSGRCVYGRPDGAPHTRYLDWLYAKLTGREPEVTLIATMRAAVVAAGRSVH